MSGNGKNKVRAYHLGNHTAQVSGFPQGDDPEHHIHVRVCIHSEEPLDMKAQLVAALLSIKDQLRKVGVLAVLEEEP